MAKYGNEAWFKLQCRVFESTIWEEDASTRIVWVTLIAEAQRPENMNHWPGCVRMSANALRRRANVSPQEFDHAMERLMAPDNWSRTNPGQPRIIEIEGGWRIPAFEEYNDPERYRARQEIRRRGGLSRAQRAERDEEGKFKPKEEA